LNKLYQIFHPCYSVPHHYHWQTLYQQL